MRTIAIINQKGGCGKTTTAINLAGALGGLDRRTLLVDLDPQSHCAAGLGVPESAIDLDSGDLLLHGDAERAPKTERLVWRVARGVDLVPSRMKLAGIEAQRGGLADMPDREQRLRKGLRRFDRGYELCLLDCPPSIGLLTYNALAAADAVLVPVETGYFSLQGATKLVTTVRSLSRRLGRTPRIWLLPTMHEPDEAVGRDLLAELAKRFGRHVAGVTIRRDERLREAVGLGKPVHEHAPTSPGALDYAALARWIIEDGCLDFEAEHELEPIAAREASDVRTPAILGPGGFSADIHAGPDPASGLDAYEYDERAGEQELAPEVRVTTRRELRDALAEAVARTEPPGPSRAAELVARAAELQHKLEKLAQSRPAAIVETPARGTGPISPVEAASVGRLYGVRATRHGLLFVQPLAIGGEIAVAGDMNRWDPEAGRMRRNSTLGVYELCLPAAPGKNRYRLVVDGRWITDPYNNNREPNPYGELNSVIEAVSTDPAAARQPAS